MNVTYNKYKVGDKVWINYGNGYRDIATIQSIVDNTSMRLRVDTSSKEIITISHQDQWKMIKPYTDEV